MAYTPLRVKPLVPMATGCQPVPVPIILDCGDHARVVTLTFSRTPQVGDRFDLDGGAWEIVHDRDLVRGYVARAVNSGVCVH